MTKDEFLSLDGISSEPQFSAAVLKDKTPRTLLWGYTCARDTWHVYLGQDQKIHLVVYNSRLLLRHQTSFTTDGSLIPDKRLIPQDCDFETCAFLSRIDVSLPFTTWDDKPSAAGAFKGKVFEELQDKKAVYQHGYELAEQFYSTVVECNQQAGRASAALVQACEELKVPYASVSPSGLYVKEDQRKQVFDRAVKLFPWAFEVKDPEQRVREFLERMNPYEVVPLPSCVTVSGGYLSAMVSLNPNIIRSFKTMTFKEVEGSSRLAVVENEEMAVRAWLTPLNKGMLGKQDYLYEECLFGEPRHSPFVQA